MTTIKGTLGTGIFEAWVSMLVQANHRKDALHLSRQRLHKSNFELSEIYFQDPNGRRHLFHVVMVDWVDWMETELTDCSNQFRVYGKFRLLLKGAVATEFHEEFLKTSALSLPSSALSSKPVLVIPMSLDQVFIEVEYHVLSWQVKTKTKKVSMVK